jgi:outer membrane protein TolC
MTPGCHSLPWLIRAIAATAFLFCASLLPAQTKQAPATLPDPKPEPAAPKKSQPYAPAETSSALYRLERTPLPIDLPTALRLADAANPTVQVAQARVREALARLDQASVLWLPNLDAGVAYNRHDGRTQNQSGVVFDVSRSNLFMGGGPQLRVELSEALYAPLIGRQLVRAETARARATTNDTQLDVALAYLDLVDVYGRLAIARDTLYRAEYVLRAAQAGVQAGINKTGADPNRAATEVHLRRQEIILLRGQIGAASARLGRLLLLDPAVDLYPADYAVVPVTLVPTNWALEQLIALGLANRPELAAGRSLLDAAQTRVRQARYGPFIPRVQLDYPVGAFGGGTNAFIGTFGARGELTAQMFWELRNLGFGNAAEVRAQRAVTDETYFRLVEVQAQVGAEISEAAKLAGARFATLNDAQEAIKQATEMYRKLRESSFQMLGTQGRLDALEALTAIQALNQSRVQYLDEVLEFNRAQFRLFTALGQPAACALPEAVAHSLDVSPLPPEGKDAPSVTNPKR